MLLLSLALSSPLAGAPLAGAHVPLNSVAFIFSLAILAGPLTADHWDVFSAEILVLIAFYTSITYYYSRWV